MSTAARAALVEVDGTPGLTLAGRLLDVADHARDTRAAAEAAGDHKTALHAGQAEARVLVALAPLDGLGPDIAEAIADADDALRLIGTVVREHPEVAAAIISVLERRNQDEWATRIRQIADSSNPETREVTS